MFDLCKAVLPALCIFLFLLVFFFLVYFLLRSIMLNLSLELCEPELSRCRFLPMLNDLLLVHVMFSWVFCVGSLKLVVCSKHADGGNEAKALSCRR